MRAIRALTWCVLEMGSGVIRVRGGGIDAVFIGSNIRKYVTVKSISRYHARINPDGEGLDVWCWFQLPPPISDSIRLCFSYRSKRRFSRVLQRPERIGSAYRQMPFADLTGCLILSNFVQWIDHQPVCISRIEMLFCLVVLYFTRERMPLFHHPNCNLNLDRSAAVDPIQRK